MIENENIKVKKNRKPLFYALSFLILAICMLFSGIFTTNMRVYASLGNPVEYYLSFYKERMNDLTGYYKDTNPETESFWGSNSNATMSDSNFEVTTGASLFYDSLNYMTFRIKLANPQLLNADRFSARIELNMVDDGGGTSTAILGMRFVSRGYEKDGSWNGHALGIEHLYNSTYYERMGLYGCQATDTTRTDLNYRYYDFMQDYGYSLVYHLEHSKVNSYGWSDGLWQVDDNGYTYVTIYTPKVDTKYYLTIEYDNKDISTQVLSTNAVSVYDILSTMYRNAVDKTNPFPEMHPALKDTCLSKIHEPEMKEITITYLEQIGNTPFATRKTITTIAPLLNNILTLENARKVIDIPTIEFMQSYCEDFTYDYVTDSYIANYRESVCLRSKDADGHEVDYFLSPNKSYREFYYSFVETGVFGQDCYNYFWNSMIRQYPEIWSISDTQLYGYFGYTVIPNKYTLNGLWDDLFDSRSFSGSIGHFAYTDTLTQSQYDTLLGEQYNYSWLARTWNNFASLFDSYDGVPVSNYLFYVNDDNSDKLWIGENGADDFYDDSGAGINGAEDIAEFLGEFFEDWGMFIFGGLGIVLILFMSLSIIRAFFKTSNVIAENKRLKKTKKRTKKRKR